MVLSNDDRRFRAPKAISGRAAGLLLSTAAVLAFGGAALAQEADDATGPSGQAEWAQRYDSDARQQVQRETTPTLSPATLAATEEAVQKYQAIVAQGGWGAVPHGTNLHVGSKGQAVVALRRRLEVTADLDQAAGISPVFDAYVEAAVKRFQARHGIGQTGIVSSQTVAALNIPADLRLRQLETNLVRLRSFAGNLGERFVMANIPAASVETVENGVVYSHHVAGVGRWPEVLDRVAARGQQCRDLALLPVAVAQFDADEDVRRGARAGPTRRARAARGRAARCCAPPGCGPRGSCCSRSP